MTFNFIELVLNMDKIVMNLTLRVLNRYLLKFIYRIDEGRKKVRVRKQSFEDLVIISLLVFGLNNHKYFVVSNLKL